MSKSYNLSLDEVFELLEEGIVDKSENERHIPIKDYEINFQSVFESKIEQVQNSSGNERDVCVVYSIWDNFAYVKYTYLSILSNYLYTDLANFDLKLLIGGSLAKFDNYLRPIFQNLGCDVRASPQFKFKYTLPRILSDYDVVFNVDSDLFFRGDQFPIYSRLSSSYLELERNDGVKTPYVSCTVDRDMNAAKRFYYPVEVLGPEKFGIDKNINSWKEDFKSIWANLECLNIDKNDINNRLKRGWMWNIFSMYNPNLFRTKNWQKLYKRLRSKELWDDEFVYSLYFWSEDIPVIYMDHFNHIHVSENGTVPDNFPNDKLSLVHPINSYNDVNFDGVKKMFSNIEYEFESKYKK